MDRFDLYRTAAVKARAVAAMEPEALIIAAIPSVVTARFWESPAIKRLQHMLSMLGGREQGDHRPVVLNTSNGCIQTAVK